MRPQVTATDRRRGANPRAWLSATALLLGGIVLSGCHTDMWNQDKMKPFYQSDFFADQSADRPLVEHTVPVGNGEIKTADPAYYTGLVNGKPIQTIPAKVLGGPLGFPDAKTMLLRGQDRYNAYCSPCHGKTGDGNGFIMQRGLGYWQKLAASYHTARLRKIQDGHIYDVLVNGYGVMYSYGARIQDVQDRWAVVSYIRALQLTRANQASAPDPYGAKVSLPEEGTTAPPPPVTEGAPTPAPDAPLQPTSVGPRATPAVPSIGIPKPKAMPPAPALTTPSPSAAATSASPSGTAPAPSRTTNP